VQDRHPTACRIIDVALTLFAERGMDATPIVRIEEAAGLAPGSGAFYKHFKSKGEVMQAARADLAAAVPDAGSLEALAGLDIRTQLTLMAAGMLATYDQHRNLVLAGLRLPVDHGLFDDSTSIGGRGVDWFEKWLEAQQSSGHTDIDDPRSTATLLLGGLFSHWLSEQLSTSGSLNIERDRLVAAWVGIVIRAIDPAPRAEAGRDE
jgi:AcrR family transcriptional regulator